MLSMPTDNLYKFYAISGLIILLFSGYYPFQKLHELNLLLTDNMSEVKFLSIQKDPLLKKVDFLEARLEKEDDFEKKRAIFDDLYKSILEINKNIISDESNRKKNLLLKEEANIYRVGGIVGLFLGFILMAISFWLWQTRVQTPLDNQLEQTLKPEKVEKPEIWMPETINKKIRSSKGNIWTRLFHRNREMSYR